MTCSTDPFNKWVQMFAFQLKKGDLRNRKYMEEECAHNTPKLRALRRTIGYNVKN